MEPEEVPYGPWREQYCAKEEDLARQKNHKFSYCPKISVVVPAYRTPEIFLRQMIESLEQQSYPNWELVIGNASPEDETMARILKEYTGKGSARERTFRFRKISVLQRIRTQRLLQQTGEFRWIYGSRRSACCRMRFLRLRSVWKRIRPSMFFIPMRTRYGLIFPNISSRISNRISIWICCGQTIISAISSLYGGRLRRKPAAFVRNTMGRRIMIISSAARKWREKLYTFREFYITGGSTALPPQTIRQASCTRMRPEKRQLRETLLRCGEDGNRHTAFGLWLLRCRL